MNKEIILASLRRLVRNFIGSFFVTFLFSINVNEMTKTIGDNFLISFKNGMLVLWGSILYPAIISALIAGFTALGKLVRDMLRENGYDKTASKILF
jgi:hypothetical protein